MKKLNIFLIIVSCILCVYSCTKETTEGPLYEDFYSDLTIIDSLSLTNYNPNFNLGDTVGFNARFSKSVPWVITITGTNSNKSIDISFPNDWEYQIYKSGITDDNFIWKNIKNITVPTLIVRAKDSNTFFESAEKEISKKNNQNIEFISLENCSHLFPLEIPEKISEIISDYIN